jgi:adenine-specific DNA-methyltransferase
MRIIQQPSVATLKPVRSDSLNFDDTQNVFIEGDNLEPIQEEGIQVE